MNSLEKLFDSYMDCFIFLNPVLWVEWIIFSATYKVWHLITYIWFSHHLLILNTLFLRFPQHLYPDDALVMFDVMSLSTTALTKLIAKRKDKNVTDLSIVCIKWIFKFQSVSFCFSWEEKPHGILRHTVFIGNLYLTHTVF